MSLPGIGVVLAIGTALAGVLYLLYQQSNAQNQYTYGYSTDNVYDNVYRDTPRILNSPPSGRSSSRKRKQYSCSICLDSLEKNTRTLDCNHSFHKHCIDTWLMQHNTCPNCRKVI